ncbi:MAG: hydrogenase nickel incorporation protein HypB [Gemmatimonadaceae bacterium]|nr:hydrogenase nickel incorporation protein HypB [Gemmatimonadaceae bacterium]
MSVRRIDVRERVMARNDEIAATVRTRLDEAGVAALNLVSSPGAGKTMLLERTLDDIGATLRLAIVTGDVQTENDADRLAAHTSRLVQAVVTNGGCHLDALQVTTALEAVALDDTDVLILENVGNLVCPASWDLGERHRVTLCSVTEGEDKPLKYPKAFAKADLVLLTKVDLLPYLRFDVDLLERNVRTINPDATILRTSAMSGEGMSAWYEYLQQAVGAARARATEAVGS